MDNMRISREERVNLLNRADCCCKRIAVVAAIEGVEQITLLTYKSNLCGCRARINSQIAVPLVGGKVCSLYMIAAMSLNEIIIGFFILKKRLKTGYLKFHLDTI